MEQDGRRSINSEAFALATPSNDGAFSSCFRNRYTPSTVTPNNVLQISNLPDVLAVPLAHATGDSGGFWAGSRVEVFEEIFLVFLVLGTLVGTVVITYMLYNAYTYRASGSDDGTVERPQLGELPTGEGGGKKLFLSFGISAVIVVALVAYAYTALLYVEQGPAEIETDDNLDVEVVGGQFYWQFTYPNGETTMDELVIPADQVISLEVTAADVWHTFGVSELRVKADAIPGQTDETWFVAEEPGEYRIECFELCGVGHSGMDGEVVVLEPDEFDEWYEEELGGDDPDDDDDEADSLSEVAHG